MSGPKRNENCRLPDGSYSVLDIIEYFENIIKKHETVANNLPIRIYGNKIESTITFKIKTELYLELLSPEIMKLLESTKSKIIKDENSESISHLENTEIVLVYINILTTIINKILEFCIRLLLILRLVNYWIFHLKILYF